ncbi:MAG: aminodeoxychorismate/anthranilate synthase component II [Gemmatimonadota bacterium]
MILLIDNYDSFVYNLARYVRELGGEPVVLRSDTLVADDIATLKPSHIIVSPGPKTPNEAGISNTAVEAFGRTTPILGVCLGHQCIGAVFGGKIVRARRPLHGKTSPISHHGTGLFHNLPNPLRATRYHSLVIDPPSLPPELVVTATDDIGEIMAVAHREWPVHGVQFHPESVLTVGGHILLRNFLAMVSGG